MFYLQLWIALNTTGVSHFFFSIHNEHMFDPTARNNYGSKYKVLSVREADRLNTTDRENIDAFMTLFVVGKTLNKNLPDKPWSKVNCRKEPIQKVRSYVTS